MPQRSLRPARSEVGVAPAACPRRVRARRVPGFVAMNVRFTVGVSTLSALVVAGFAACSASGNDAGGGPAGPDVDGGPPVVVNSDAAPDTAAPATDDSGTVVPPRATAARPRSPTRALRPRSAAKTPARRRSPTPTPASPPGTCNALTDCPYTHGIIHCKL